MRNWYEIRAASGEPEIWIYGDIGESWFEETTSAADFVAQINALEADRITVRINSYGGSVPDGLAIYNAIKRHSAHVTVAIDGVAMSCASLIAMAGDTVEMAENAILMIHAPWIYCAGNAAELREYADQLDTWSEAMATSYVAQSGKSKEDVIAILADGKDHYFTAEEALAEGYVDSVVESISIAASAKISEAAMVRFTKSNTHAGSLAREQTMTEEEKKAAEAKAKADAKAADDAKAKEQGEVAAKAAKEALAKDKERREGIQATFKPFIDRDGMSELQAELLENHEMTPEAAGQKILAKMAEGAEPVAGSIRVTGDDGTERFRRDAVASLLVKAGLANDESRNFAKASNFGSFKLLDFAKASLDRAGVNHSSMNQMEVVAAAFTTSTSDFPVLLENAMHKALQEAYAVAPDTWSRFCATGSVSDFRAHNRYRTGSLGNLESLNELGEFKNKTIPDGEKGSITADTKGNVINISRKTIVNDDLGAFLSLAAMLGRAGRRTIEAAVYALLAENSGLGPVLVSDSKTLFHADHGNIGSGAALSVTSIEADRVLMASQTDVGDNDFLDLRPSLLVVPVGLGGTARQVNEQEYDDEANKNQRRPNVVRGLFDDVVDTPRMSGTRRYMFADPNVAPVIEVAFLDGNQEPYIEQQMGFTVDGTQFKARLDFGVAAIDYRGATTDAGA